MGKLHLLLRGALPLILLLGCLTLPSSAQQDPRALDPSDVFFQAWLTIRDAEKLEKAGEFNGARQKYEQAAKYYNVISRFHKNWKPHMVEARVKSTSEAINNIEAKAIAEIAAKNAKTQDFVEGGGNQAPNQGMASGNQKQPTRPPVKSPIKPIKSPVKPPASQVSTYTQAINRGQLRQLENLQRDNQRLRQDLARAKKTTQQGETAEQQRLIKKIADKDKEITTIRDLLARAPLQQDMDKLARKNRTIKAELDITALSLKGTMEKLAKAQKDAKKYQNDAQLAERKTLEIQKNMDAQKGADNRVVQALRKELKTVNQMLEKTRGELGKANAQMAQMQRSLDQSKSTIHDLTQERDSLRTERDSLAIILKKNDAEGVRKLITENMRLGKELKETSARLEYLTKKNNVSQDELLEAKRDLAVAKTRIMRYQQERTRHSSRIRSLESQLRDAEAELAAAETSPEDKATQEEVEDLKATVKRLIAAQDRRQNAEKILWETYKNSKKIIPGIIEAFDDIRKEKIELTEEEKGLMVLRRPDREFTSPDRVSPEHAQAYGSALEKDLDDHNRLVKRFYVKGHYEAARQVLADMDERFPGHFPTLMNRGVLELKTENYIEASDIFSEAITMRENSSYAHYMLGSTHYHNNDLDAARNEFQQALDLKPGDARAQFYLGNIAGVQRRYQQAEEHFNTAIKLDPTMADAYFNLSFLHLRQKNKDAALKAYNKALNNGAQPDPDHEAKLGM